MADHRTWSAAIAATGGVCLQLCSCMVQHWLKRRRVHRHEHSPAAGFDPRWDGEERKKKRKEDERKGCDEKQDGSSGTVEILCEFEYNGIDTDR